MLKFVFITDFNYQNLVISIIIFNYYCFMIKALNQLFIILFIKKYYLRIKVKFANSKKYFIMNFMMNLYYYLFGIFFFVVIIIEF